MADPTYFDDFWTEPGYLGHDAPPSLRRDIVQHPCEVAATISDHEAEELGLAVGRQPGQAAAASTPPGEGPTAVRPIPVAVRLSSSTGADVLGADLIVTSGRPPAGSSAPLAWWTTSRCSAPAIPRSGAARGRATRVEVDNRGFLAAQTYHRHQVPAPDFHVWDQFRDADGTPIYPQRPLLLGPLFAAAAAGHGPDRRATRGR